jgi:phosphoglycerate dehydrogenase-like enzyme
MESFCGGVDVLRVHVPLLSETVNLGGLGEQQVRAMKRGRMNFETLLVRALDDGHV